MSRKRESRLGKQAAEAFAPAEAAHPLTQIDATALLIKGQEVLAGPEHPLQHLDQTAMLLKGEEVLAGPEHPLQHLDQTAMLLKGEEMLAGPAHPLQQVDATAEQLQAQTQSQTQSEPKSQPNPKLQPVVAEAPRRATAEQVQAVLNTPAHPLSHLDAVAAEAEAPAALEPECPPWLVWPLLAWSEAAVSWCRVMEPWFSSR